MKASAGKPKVLMLAFGHPDNVLSLCKAVSRHVCIELVFVVSGDRFRQGILDIDISTMPYGLNPYDVSKRFLPAEVNAFIGVSFNIRFLRTPSRKLVRQSGWHNLKIIHAAGKRLNQEAYQTVHYNGVSGFIALFRLVLHPSRKNIWTIHDYIPHSGEANPKAYIFIRLIMMLGFEYIQHYQWLRKRFIAHYRKDPRKVHHVYSGAFSIFNYYAAKKKIEIQNYILFFGRISPYKGIDFLVTAFLRFKAIHPELGAKLCIAGSGNLWFDNAVVSHPDIFFINRYIQSGELAHLIQNCRFVVLPYTDSTHSAVVMTSYAFCKPVVATDVGGLHEVIQDGKTGFLVPRGNLDGMASAMAKLSWDDKLLRAFQGNIRRFISDGPVSWDFVSHRMRQIYVLS